MAKDPVAATQKWVTGMQGAGQAIADGVNAVTVAPGAAAARQKNVYVQNTTAAADKWARNVQAVSLGDWKEAMLNKGVNRVGTGAAASQGKMQNAMTQLLPQIDAIVNSLPPRGDLGANINRMTQFVQKMSAVKINK